MEGNEESFVLINRIHTEKTTDIAEKGGMTMIDYKNTAFEKEEYQSRVRRVQGEMEKRGLELLLVHEIGNICWLCGVQCLCWNKYFMLLVPLEGDPYLVIQSFEINNAYLNTWLEETHIIPYYSCEIGKLGKHLERYMWHGLYGYCIGLGFPPRWDDCGSLFIKRDDFSILEPGMVFHVSTTLRDIGRHSITASETVVVTEIGNEVVTSVPRMLYIK